MILRKEIAEKSALWGVPPDTVDKDWVLGHFLSAFYQVNEHFKKLVFKGGTYLRKCRFPDFRFSEDLDFTSRDPDYKLSRGLINAAIVNVRNNAGILLHLAEVRDLIYKDKLAGFQANIQYWGANHGKNQPPPEPERWLSGIKIEVTLYEILVFEEELCQIDHPYSDIDLIGNIEIPCYDLKEVMAEKIRSLVQRSYTAPRDVYDIWILKDHIKDPEWEEVNKAFQSKMRFKGYVYTGLDQLINEKSIDILRRSWTQSLGHQLQSSSLPDVDMVTNGLIKIFEKHLVITDK
jgi:predicted nucleotidyltransferase component of viral defense system